MQLEDLKLPEELDELQGFEEFLGLLQTPDVIFDTMFSTIMLSLKEEISKPETKEQMKVLGNLSKEEYQKFEKGIKDLIEIFKNEESISKKKKDFFCYLFESLLTTDFDAIIPIELSSPTSSLPVYANPTDAGADIFINQDIEVLPFTFGLLISTGLRVAIPEGWKISILPRSGISKRTTLRVSNSPGTIDSGYRGEIGILVDNLGNDPIYLKKGDKIAQIVLEKVHKIKWEQVENVSKIGIDRKGGFGSTDEKKGEKE